MTKVEIIIDDKGNAGFTVIDTKKKSFTHTEVIRLFLKAIEIVCAQIEKEETETKEGKKVNPIIIARQLPPIKPV